MNLRFLTCKLVANHYTKEGYWESQHHRNSYLPHEKMAREYSKNMSDIFIIIFIYFCIIKIQPLMLNQTFV